MFYKSLLISSRYFITTQTFKHNFQDCLNPICSCGQEIETTSHFLLHCLNYRCARKTFFEKINLIDSNILQQSDLSITNDLLFGSEKLKDDKNNALLTSTIEFIQSTERFKYIYKYKYNKINIYINDSCTVVDNIPLFFEGNLFATS